MTAPKDARPAPQGNGNLPAVIAAADPAMEPAADQPAILDGKRRVTMLACLDRTAVVLIGNTRVLVRHDRLDVDAETLAWRRRMLSSQQDWARAKYARQAAKHKRESA